MAETGAASLCGGGRRALQLGSMKGHIMQYGFETVEEADFDPPPLLAGWLYVAGFKTTLPDRINCFNLKQKIVDRGWQRVVTHVIEGPEEYGLEVVTDVHFLLAPGFPEVAAWLTEQLDIIERDGILDEAMYWPLVDPVLQKLWEEASPADRAVLCTEADEVDHVFDQAVPPGVHDILYRQISV